MTDVIYPTADFAADEFHQKYGFNDIKSDTALTLVAMGEKTLDTGFAMNELSKGVIAYGEAHNKPAADKFINSYNTIMDQYNTVLQHSNHPIAKVVGGVGGFLGQPMVAAGGLGVETLIADAGVAIKGAGLSSFIGEKSAGFMAHLGESRLAAIGGRSLLTGAEAALVTVPEAISHAYLAQSTPIRDDYNYMDALREVGQNFLLGSVIHLGIVEPIKAGVKHLTKKYTPPVQVATSESMRKAAGKVESDLINDEEPNARAELHQGFNDQRNSGRDPTVEEVRASAVDVREKIAKIDSKIKDLQKEVKEPVKPYETLSAFKIANRIERIEIKPREMRTELEKSLLKTLPRNEIIEELGTAITKHEMLLTPEEDELINKLQKSRTTSIKNERKIIEERTNKYQEKIDTINRRSRKLRDAGEKAKANKLQKDIVEPQRRINKLSERLKSFEEKPTMHSEKVLRKIDALEDQRANMNDILGNHQEALDILQEPKTAVDPKESDTKPMFYSDTDPISDADKITPEEEESGRPEGLDIKESEFSEKGKQELEAVREEKQELSNYDKLMARIVECITNVFYKG